MNPRHDSIDTALQRTASRWRGWRFLQHSATLGTVVGLGMLALGASMRAGWITVPGVAKTLMVLWGTGALLAWIVIAISVLGNEPQRRWLANCIERGQPLLLDRLNTLVFLEKSPRSLITHSFYQRIANQARAVLAEKKSTPPLPVKRSLAHGLVFLAVLAATLFVYERYSPWQNLLAAYREKLAAEAKAKTESAAELTLPDRNTVEKKMPWGEVRISEPGRDLSVTKVDVVPLQIEAAANEPLHRVEWLSAVNGAGEKPHELAPPAEPGYAVYQPTLYLDEWRLTDWDVLTYYARALTERSNAFASEIYFLEVRPFREDLLKMPGGENGFAGQCLNELTRLIQRQQQVIRQTHQHAQNPPDPPHRRMQERTQLAEAETELRQGVNDLYDQMANEPDSGPIRDTLDHLTQAGKGLHRAAQLLRDDAMDPAQVQERSALADLVAARKLFHKAVGDHPAAFSPANAEENLSAAESLKRLKAIAEFRNEAKATQDFIQKILDQQQGICHRLDSASRLLYPGLAAEEQGLQGALKDFQSQHPRMFRHLEPESAAVHQALTNATQALQHKSGQAQSQARQAAEELAQLKAAMDRQILAQSQPPTAQQNPATEALKPGQWGPIECGLAQLQSLIQRSQNQRQAPAPDQMKQGLEAWHNLQTGLRDRFGQDERIEAILLQLERALKKKETLTDPLALQALVDELQNLAFEVSAQREGRESKPEMTHIDPSRVPPAYRERIEKYFQRLSEK